MKTLLKPTIYQGLLLALVVFSSSCTYKEEREQLKQQAADLEQQLQERDSAFNEVLMVMTEVETEITNIKNQENLISTSAESGDEEGDKFKLVSDIKRINERIQFTNDKIRELAGKLDNSNLQLSAFKRKVDKMTSDLKEREASLAELRTDLEQKNLFISELNTEVKSLVQQVQLQTETISVQSQELIDKEKALNTGYFVIGKEKQLLADGLISKEGGFLWIGKSLDLVADAAPNKFTEVDIQNTKKFYVDAEKMAIITEHPADSYKIVSDAGKVKYIEVVNPDEFWRISKYLVINVKS